MANIRELERGYQASRKPQQPVKKKSGGWISFLPSAAASLASLVPGVGTAAAAGLGGLGEAGRELITGEGLNARKIGTEAGLSAIPGGLGKLNRLRKAAKAGTTATKAVEGAVETASKPTTRSIPVKYTPTASKGVVKPESASKLLINPTVGQTQEAASDLVKRGYKISGKVGNYSSATTATRKTTPVVKMEGTKTGVTFPGETTESPEILTGTGVPEARAAAIQRGKEITEPKASLLSRVRRPEVASQGDNVLTRTGDKLRSSNRGIQAGDKIGKEVLDEKSAKEINSAINKANKGVTSRTVRGQINQVQQAKQAAGQAVTDAAKASKAAVSDEARSAAETSIAKGRSKILSFDENNASHTKLNNRYAERLTGAKTPEQLLEARRVFDTAAKKVYTNPDATQTVDKELASVYRKQADKLLSQVAPDIKAADKEYSTLTKAEKALTAKSSNVNPSGAKPFGSSLNGRGIGGGTVQATKEGAGKALQVAGSNATTPTLARGLTAQVAARAGMPIVDAATPPEDTMIPGATEAVPDPSEVLNYQDPNAVLNAQPDPAEAIQGQLDAAIQQALANGDTKGLDNLLKVSDYYASRQKASGGAKGLNSTASGVVADTKTGLASLEALSGKIADSSANNPIIGQIRSKNPFDTNAQNLQASIATAKQIVGKALEGGVLRKEDEYKYAKILPTVGDTDAVAQHKIQELVNLISGRLNEYQSSLAGGSGGTDLATLGVQ